MAAKGLSKSDVIGIALGFLLLAPLAAQVVGADREFRNRSVCAANLRGIAQSINVYAADNADAYPIYEPTSATTYSAATDGAGLANNSDKTIVQNYGNKAYGNNPLAAMWLLVLNGQVAPRQFLCPSDTLAGKAAQTIDKDRKYFSNFQSAGNFSYSIPFPWTEDSKKKVPVISGLWRNMTDASQPVISDMAPYLGKGGKNGTPATRAADAKEDDPVDAQWAVKKANSQNHGFDGQNVGYGDAHAEFTRNPAVGQNNDSLWGIRDDKGKETPIEPGELSHPPSGAPGAFDIVMVPVRDAKGDIKGATPLGGNFTDLP